MVSQSQIDFFAQLLGEKDFGAVDKVQLSKEFAALDKRSGSAWIEKAMALPKLQDSHLPEIVPPKF